MTIIYAWPPVAAVQTMWTDVALIRRSYGHNSGRRFVSSAGPRRRKTSVLVAAIGCHDRDGAGYSESLKRLLEGGVNLVRLQSPIINWRPDYRKWPHLTAPLSWTTGGDPLGWTAGGEPLYWFSGPAISATAGTDTNGLPTLTASGFQPGALVCRAYDGIRVYAADHSVSSAVSRAVRTVHADATGEAVIALHDALPAGIISIGDHESAVFEVEEMPQAPQPLGANWFYQWSFREVLPNEYDGATEVNPWA